MNKAFIHPEKFSVGWSAIFPFIIFSPFYTYFCLQERSAHLTELGQKPGSDTCTSQSPKLRPRPPGRRASWRESSCHHSRVGLQTGVTSQSYSSSPHLSSSEQFHISSPSTHPEAHFCPCPSTAEPFRYTPTQRRGVSSSGISWKSL